MNPKNISHRLFIAALAPGDQAPVKRPAAARSAGAIGPAKINPAKTAAPFPAVAARQVSDWSWSGWQQNTI